MMGHFKMICGAQMVRGPDPQGKCEGRHSKRKKYYQESVVQGSIEPSKKKHIHVIFYAIAFERLMAV